jgi:hypothetical protein
MGQAAERKKRFFEQHPRCCFCGGEAAATTQDHWPPRSFFVGRIWPEDHVFPACGPCNSASRVHEMLFAMICRIRFSPTQVGVSEEEAQREWEKNARGVAQVLPETYRSMLLSVTKKRSRARRLGLQPGLGETYRDVPIMSIDHFEFYEASKTVARKLFCALYYLRTGRPLTSRGGIVFLWTSNAHGMDQLLSTENLRPILAHFPPIQRGRGMLNDQFACAYTVIDAYPPSALFAVQLNDAVAMIGAVFGDISGVGVFDQIPDIENHQVFPYRWAE